MNESSGLESSSDDRTCIRNNSDEERNTKKKEKLLGNNGTESGDSFTKEDLVIEDGDILRSSVNGIPAIDFFE
ncbi:hypothetical protein J1N35_041906 [Gossypium stocksii]|uniref:Uncharacterized protein n=1 Tax=Gossypium stocksii TaxID=47602 RepID=A0A9D3UIC2_9ROSI|nr:hypothetical protein J1N35_041906 [Gossypium stocksii]